VRLLTDAVQCNGLLKRAVRQLHHNWNGTQGRQRKKTWLGRAMQMIRKTWPRFSISLPAEAGIRLEGTPDSTPLHTAFFADAALRQWSQRQTSVIRAQPTQHQHDYFLNVYLRALCSEDELTNLGRRDRIAPLKTNIFPACPDAEADAVRVLLRTLAGLEDFARITAHHDRRATHPALALNCFKRSCLFCLVYDGSNVIDSEWHAFCECPHTKSARHRFQSRTSLEIHGSNPCTVHDLRQLVQSVSSDPGRSGALAQLSLNIRSTRRHLFRRLSATGPSGRAMVAARLSALQES
jgi:hypothetical protein